MAKAKQRYFCQCKFTQPSEGPGNHRFDVAWIPKEHAVVGKWIQIDGREGNWKVVEVWSTKTEQDALACERDYKKQRSQSDIERRPDRKLKQ